MPFGTKAGNATIVLVIRLQTAPNGAPSSLPLGRIAAGPFVISHGFIGQTLHAETVVEQSEVHVRLTAGGGIRRDRS
jgi:hypothetical protein